MKKITITFAFLFLIILSIVAQKGTIKGRILNAKTNEPIEFSVEAQKFLQVSLEGSVG